MALLSMVHVKSRYDTPLRQLFLCAHHFSVTECTVNIYRQRPWTAKSSSHSNYTSVNYNKNQSCSYIKIARTCIEHRG